MSQHADILDERDASLSRPLIGSLVLHVGVVALVAGFAWYKQVNAVQWGVENPMGGAIGVTAVEKIPLPNRGIKPNPVASDSDSTVPQKPDKKEQKKVPVDEPDAIPLNSRNQPRKPSEPRTVARRYEPTPLRPNQVTNTTGQAVNSPIYGKTGIGGIGIGESTIAGRGCTGYLELVRQRIQVKWDSQSISAGLRAGVSLNLILQRSGVVRDVSILQSSNNSEIDFAARRAISEASPFQPFLPNCEGNEAKIEVRFEPKR